VPYFQILCIGGFFSALYNFSYYAVAAVGKSKALFYWGCYKWSMLLVLLLIGASISMTGVLIAMVISNINIYVTNALLAQRYIGYRLSQQIIDVLPMLGCTLVCGGVGFMLYSIVGLHWVLSSGLFVILYLVVCYLCRLDAIKYVKHSVKSLITKCQ
jgi:O-antigen/teichoic acid export membrane protein